MEIIRGVRLAGERVDCDAITAAVNDPDVQIVDASRFPGDARRVIAAVQRGLSGSQRVGRFAVVVAMPDWLLLGGEPNRYYCGVHELNYFSPHQLASHAVHRWIESGDMPRLDLAPLLKMIGECLDGPDARVQLRRAARMIRAAHWRDRDRAAALDQLLAVAQRHLLCADVADLAAEVRMLRRNADARDAEPGPDDSTRHAMFATIRRVLERDAGRAPGKPEIPPWLAWLFVTLVRYRAAQVDFLSRHASGIFTASDVEQGSMTGCLVTRDKVCDRALLGLSGMLVSEPLDQVTERHVWVDRRWFLPGGFPQFVEKTKATSYAAERLWRWFPGERCLMAWTIRAVQQFGGVECVRGEDTMWLALPEALEDLVPLLGGAYTRCTAPDDFYDRTLVDAQCNDYEALGHQEMGALLAARHRQEIARCIDQGELMVTDAIPALFPNEVSATFDRVIAAHEADADSCYEVFYLIERHQLPIPDALLRVVEHLTPTSDLSTFEEMFPLLVQRQIAPDLVVSKLRALCGLDGTTSDWMTCPPTPYLLVFALAIDPEAGRTLARMFLASHDEGLVEHAAGDLAAIGTPWALDLLGASLATAEHPSCIARELAAATRPRIKVVPAGQPDAQDDDALTYRRAWVERSLDKDLLAALFAGVAPVLH